MYQDLSTRHDWPVKKAIVNLPIKLKENSNAFPVIVESVGGQEQEYRRCLADVTSRVKLPLQRRLAA